MAASPPAELQRAWDDARAQQYELAFTEARRALDRQAASLDGIRSRAGVLVAASSLVTSFIGSGASGAGPALVVALVAYFGVVMLAVVILWPVRRWRLGADPKRLLEDYIDREDYASLPEMHRALAVHMDGWYETNQRRLNQRLALFAVACMLLVVEVVALVIELQG